MLTRRNNGSENRAHEATGMMRWLLTYADLITLLMVFFVVMYAISSIDSKKYNALRSSLQTALRTSGGASAVLPYAGTNPIEMPVTLANRQRENAEFNQIIQQVQGMVPNQQAVAFSVDERGLTIRFLDNVLFDLGRAELRPEARQLLGPVAQALAGVSNYVRVEGYTDDLPINTVQYPSNWELSAARAINVTRYLIQQYGLDPKRFSSLGYGEYRPLYPNTSESNRQKNRRVDIVILRSSSAGGEVAAPAAPQPR